MVRSRYALRETTGEGGTRAGGQCRGGQHKDGRCDADAERMVEEKTDCKPGGGSEGKGKGKGKRIGRGGKGRVVLTKEKLLAEN